MCISYEMMIIIIYYYYYHHHRKTRVTKPSHIHMVSLPFLRLFFFFASSFVSSLLPLFILPDLFFSVCSNLLILLFWNSPTSLCWTPRFMKIFSFFFLLSPFSLFFKFPSLFVFVSFFYFFLLFCSFRFYSSFYRLVLLFLISYIFLFNIYFSLSYSYVSFFASSKSHRFLISLS